MDIKRELIKIEISKFEKNENNEPDGDFRKLGFGDEDLHHELSVDDALDKKSIKDIKKMFLSDLVKKDEFQEFEKFGQDFQASEPMLLNSFMEKFSDDEKGLLFRLKGLRRV